MFVPVINEMQEREQAVLLPIAAGFSEEAVIRSLSLLRSQCIRVWLVGEIEGGVRGNYGVTLQTDYSWRSLPELAAESVVLLTGSIRNVRSLFNNPSFHFMLNEIVRDGGKIGVSPDEYAYTMAHPFGRHHRLKTAQELPNLLTQLTSHFIED